MSLEHLFRPRGVAVVGSMRPGKIGSVLIGQILDGGYTDLFAVNPRGEGARGVPGFRSLEEIGRPVDLVVIASPPETVASVIEDAGRSGAKAAIVITAGFSEVGNVEGEMEVVEVARRYGIRLVGPNCAGIVDTASSLYPTLETRPPAGEVAFVSQSGALGGAVLSWAAEQGVGFSKFVSYGNGADLTEVDFLDYLRRDPDSRVVCLYIETVSKGDPLAHRIACRRGSGIRRRDPPGRGDQGRDDRGDVRPLPRLRPPPPGPGEEAGDRDELRWAGGPRR